MILRVYNIIRDTQADDLAARSVSSLRYVKCRNIRSMKKHWLLYILIAINILICIVNICLVQSAADENAADASFFGAYDSIPQSYIAV